MVSRQQRRADARAKAKRDRAAKSGFDTGHPNIKVSHIGDGGMSIDEAVEKMTGIAHGDTFVSIDQVPEELRPQLQAIGEAFVAEGLGPCSIIKKADGAYSVRPTGFL